MAVYSWHIFTYIYNYNNYSVPFCRVSSQLTLLLSLLLCSVQEDHPEHSPPCHYLLDLSVTLPPDPSLGARVSLESTRTTSPTGTHIWGEIQHILSGRARKPVWLTVCGSGHLPKQIAYWVSSYYRLFHCMLWYICNCEICTLIFLAVWIDYFSLLALFCWDKVGRRMV